MKSARPFILAALLIILSILTACSDNLSQNHITSPAPSETEIAKSLPHSSGQIYLYGEQHGNEKILDKEFELWYNCYHNEGMRHLFIEHSYYTAEFLNLWMQSESDDILETIYNDWVKTASHVTCIKDFYKKIKVDCPETVFHGTDVGHQRDTTGERFLSYLKTNKLEETNQYLLTQEAIEQGKFYYTHDDDLYRENKMAENFVREFDSLGGENIMGIYGSAHTGLDAMTYNNPSNPCMASQLKEIYGDAIHSEDLTSIALDIDPLRIDTITVNAKDYEASYFGEADISNWSKDYVKREFWRLENAYDDFKDRPKTGNILPYDNYLMLIEEGQVFVIDYTRKDGSIIRQYLRSDGYVWEGKPSTEGFKIEY